jgi:hypothetical protein
MRHTLDLPDTLSHNLKLRALTEGTSLRELLQKAAVAYLQDQSGAATPRVKPSKHFRIDEETGLPVLTGITKTVTSQQVYDLMEELGV